MSGFWFFMLVMVLLVPLTMMLFGYLFYFKPPKDINGIYGYRQHFRFPTREKATLKGLHPLPSDSASAFPQGKATIKGRLGGVVNNPHIKKPPHTGRFLSC